MVKKNILVFSVLFFPFISAALAVETSTVIPASPPNSNLPGAFAVVSNEDTMKVNPGQVFTEGDDSGITYPYLISDPKPIIYPSWAVRQGWKGEFLIAMEVLADGSIGKYFVMKSTGYKVLDEAATKAVLSWKFHPAMKNGQPIRECFQIPIRFELQAE